MNTGQTGWQARSKVGVIAGGGAQAVEAGAQMLREGGNAFDAGITTVLALQITDHGDCSIGGEVPILVYDAASRQVHAISGMGSAPTSREAIEWYMANGIPEAGDIKIAPVPSVVDACCTVLARWGTISFARAIQPTLDLLDQGGEDWHPRLARTLRRMKAAEAAHAGTRGEKIMAASDLFYGRGDDQSIAQEQEDFWVARGGFLRKADLAAHRTRIEQPVSVSYHGVEVYKCGPWTQGPVLCQMLRLLDGMDLGAWGADDVRTIHTVTEAMKLAFADRDHWYGDPEFVDVPLKELFSGEYNRLRRALIDPHQASKEQRPGDPLRMLAQVEPGPRQPSVGGTTTCVCADSEGNLIAATPSANVLTGHHDAGAAGVTFGNRLRSFNTTPGHPNCIQPGKRPRITLTPTLALKNGEPFLAMSVAGGDMQDQAGIQLLLDVIDFGLSPSEAVRRPRYVTNHMQDSFDPNPDRPSVFMGPGTILLNQAMPGHLAAGLEARGHAVTISSSPLGHPVLLSRDPVSGEMEAAGDPIAGRHAAAA